MKKFVEKMKRFWSLDAKTSGGFTLVELIVVIAILAILAGIAIPAYSGYVEKAKKAEDEQLLATINTAFAAACIENGVDVHSVYGASFDEENMAVTGTITLESGSVDAAAYNTAFQTFFAGNEDAEFSTIEGVYFDAVKHAFSDTSEGTMAMSYGGGIVYINAEDAEKLAASTFITAEGLGVEGLLEKVNDVTSYAALMSGTNALNTVLSSQEFIMSAAAALGIETEGKSPQEISLAVNAKKEELAAKMGGEDAESQVMANAAVLFAAQNATNMSTSDITDLLSNDGAAGKITANLSSDTGTALSQAALAYGMYTAYAYSTGDGDLIANTKDPALILGNLDDDEFQKYIAGEQGQADLNGYLSALEMINSSTGDTSAVENLMVNGFDDPELAALLNQVLGK